MNGHVKSLTLSREEVARIIERHVNEEILRVPHRVVDIDPWGYDERNDMQFNIGLAPMELPAVEPVHVTVHAVTLPEAAPITAANGTNGHGDLQRRDDSGGATAAKEDAAVSQPDGPKRQGGRGVKISAEIKAEVLRRRAAGDKVPDIAAASGISEGSCYEIIAEHRRFERSLGRAEDVQRPPVVG